MFWAKLLKRLNRLVTFGIKLIVGNLRFEEYEPVDEFDNKCYEVTAVFSVSAFQYISMAVIFSKGAPYRKAMFTNCEFSC